MCNALRRESTANQRPLVLLAADQRIACRAALHQGAQGFFMNALLHRYACLLTRSVKLLTCSGVRQFKSPNVTRCWIIAA